MKTTIRVWCGMLGLIMCCLTCFSCKQPTDESSLPVNHYYVQSTYLNFPDTITLVPSPDVYSATGFDGKIHFYSHLAKEMLSFNSGIESYPDKNIIPFVKAFYESNPIRFIGLAEQLIIMGEDKAYDYFLISYDSNNFKSTVRLTTEVDAMIDCIFENDVFIAVYKNKVDIYKIDFEKSEKNLVNTLNYSGDNIHVCLSPDCVFLTHDTEEKTALTEYRISDNTYKTGELPYAGISAVACAPDASASSYCLVNQNALVGIDADLQPSEQFLDIKTFIQNILNGEKITGIYSIDSSFYITTSGNNVFVFDELTGDALESHMQSVESQDDVTLKIFLAHDDGYINNMSAMYPYADVNIEVYEAPHTEFSNYVSTSLLSGSVDWDIITVTSPYMPVHNYIEEGYLFSLDKYIDTLPSDEWFNQIFDMCEYKAKHYVFPVGITLDVLVRNDGTEISPNVNIEDFIDECSSLHETKKIPLSKNRFNVNPSVPIKTLTANIENGWKGDIEKLVADVFSINKAISNEDFYGSNGVYTYILSAGPAELNQAGVSVMTSPGYHKFDMDIGGTAVVQYGFSILENSENKEYALDYMAFLAKYVTSSVSPYKKAYVYDNPETIERLLDSTSNTQLFSSELSSQLIDINDKYVSGALTMDEAVSSAKDKIWFAMGE